MSLPVRIDDALIERVFQPAIDRLGTSPFDVARNCLIGATVLAVAGAVIGWRLEGLFGCTFSVLAFLLFWRTCRLAEAEVRKGRINPERCAGAAWMRVLFLALVSPISLWQVAFAVAGVASPKTGLIGLGSFIFLAAAYAMACSMPPPKEKRAATETRFARAPG